MMEPAVDYEVGLQEDLEDAEEAAAYLNAALEDGSQDVFLLALRDLAASRGFSQLARDAALNRENLYRILSESGNPQLSSLRSLLNSLGFELAVKPRQAA